MTWVLLRGLMREQRHWGAFLTSFQTAFADESVITIDFPGNGEQHLLRSASSIQAMVEAARQQVHATGATRDIKVLAISLGAMVAVAWARAHPQEIHGLVLINTSLAPHNHFYQRLRPQNYPRLLATMLFGTVRQREQLVFDLTCNQCDTHLASTAVQAWISYAQQYPISRGNIIRQLIAAMRYHAPQEQPHPSLLLLAGKGDRLVNPVCSRILAKKWRCTLLMHPLAGHDLPLDDGAWIIAQVKHWISE
ncbi:alpha/beta fold hydrolase [Undibacterium sp. RuRC25W]|uniref:alpha/beta fold hydrolase n=1 Tax=Undibacterium sp. RuRC25W TaxID=3413047 RepID=UPI003BF0E60D